MIEARHERAPGDRPSREMNDAAPSEFLVYTIGLVVAALLTATSFWAANTTALWPGGVFLGLSVLAIAQMGVHLVFFLHVTSGPESTNNVLALAFGVLIVFVVITGTIWIVADMNANMVMPSSLSASMSMKH
ncbi:cytochrome o ubiquinol oxidase subunit IV [Tardiphaga alba]|uniref:Cytochrome bo(3) ubiquinol oxidase subunit 4 n=1 Tax=Tardiphaga alba TaxID=340268 RepID=A0ABX8AI04_9BRAD|nr:cytochrome o ubiquinol oxidase subunit IV [Tardiphaga alba]QUS41955.1 cytochrome o ubiquinol oxidase subunit IV [Tardiphaga alba]